MKHLISLLRRQLLLYYARRVQGEALIIEILEILRGKEKVDEKCRLMVLLVSSVFYHMGTCGATRDLHKL